MDPVYRCADGHRAEHEHLVAGCPACGKDVRWEPSEQDLATMERQQPPRRALVTERVVAKKHPWLRIAGIPFTYCAVCGAEKTDLNNEDLCPGMLGRPA